MLIGVGNKASDYDEADVRELWHIGSDLWRIIIRRRVEHVLRESEARYRVLFQFSNDAVALIDMASGRFIDGNAAAVAFYDTGTREALIGLRPEDLSPPNQPLGVASVVLAQAYLQQAAHEGGAVFEWIQRRQDGTLFPALISLSGVKVQGKDHVLVIGRDISELKRYQAELEQARDAAETANRAKSAFLANMSHELRTPLSAILGRVELLREQIYGPLTERQQAALGTMESSGAHLLELIADLLDLSKIEVGQIALNSEPVVTRVLCRSALQVVQPEATAKAIPLTLTVDPAIDIVVVDPRRFQQILVNLLANAVKFTPAGGHVELVVSGDPEAQQATFTVSDTGIGIASDDLQRLFKPFVQIDTRLSRTYEGSGLGLALALRLAELHGGSVRVASDLGVGSRFSVVVPWSPAAQPSATLLVEPYRPASSDGMGRLVLIAEDNQATAQLLLDYLPALGYRCIAVQNGAEAVDRARALRPDVILMDVQMPVLDGLAATRQIRAIAELRATPIIALTALAMAGDAERGLAAGINVYLTKPVTLRQIRAVIAEQLGQRTE
jgi:PAS domain S-box-containing protein